MIRLRSYKTITENLIVQFEDVRLMISSWKVKITPFKAKLEFTVARIDLVFNEFSSKVKRYCNYKILVFNYILFAAQKEEMAENTV